MTNRNRQNHNETDRERMKKDMYIKKGTRKIVTYNHRKNQVHKLIKKIQTICLFLQMYN